MTFEEKRQYKLALREGQRRFGSACRHRGVKNGQCVNCLRKVLHKKRV